MAMVTYVLHRGQPLTDEQRERLEALKQMNDDDIVYETYRRTTCTVQARQSSTQKGSRLMIIRQVIYEGQRPTPEQIAEIEALKNRPIVFDED